MTEEAIKHLETYSTTNGSGQTSQAQHEKAKRIAIKALEQGPVLDKIRAEIGKSKTKREWQLAENDIKGKLLISDIYCDIVSILDRYKAEMESEE